MGKYDFAVKLIKQPKFFTRYCAPHIRPQTISSTKGFKLSHLEKDVVQISKKPIAKSACRIEHSENSLNLLDESGNIVSKAFFYENGLNSLTLLDLSSSVKGKGYGTMVLNAIKQKYPSHNISLSACWERGLADAKPPHKFYMQNGFVPTEQDALESLTKWINNGAKTSEFPTRYTDCAMIYKPSS